MNNTFMKKEEAMNILISVSNKLSEIESLFSQLRDDSKKKYLEAESDLMKLNLNSKELLEELDFIYYSITSMKELHIVPIYENIEWFKELINEAYTD